MKRDRTVLLANAGSGKTFTLANRVLAWCLAEIRAGRPAAPANILAVTFTRKAAGEILARIVSHAALGARDDDRGAEARKSFADSVGEASVDEYRAILAAICDDLHRMQVGTIDGYLHRVAMSMPEELGLPCGWMIAEPHEMDEILAAASAAVLADPVAEELLDLLEDGAPKPSVGASIEGLLGDSAYAVLTLYRATIAGGETALDRAWGWANRLRRDVGLGAEATCDRLKQLAKDLEAAPLARNAKGEVNGRWKPAHRTVVDALREGRVRDAGTRFVTGILETGAYSNAKADPRLRPVLERVATEVRIAYLDELVGRMEGALRAMPIAEKALREAQFERGLYSFTDIGREVAQAARNPASRAASAAEVRATLGCDVRALAIDEAQETSVAQFRALRPLIDEVLGVSGAQDRSHGKFLLVGDPKQSIYGWRGGVPGQIESFRRDAAAFLDPDETLAKSFRSSPLVLAFVNELFGSLKDDLLPLTTDEHREDLVGLVDFLGRERIDPIATSSAFVRTLSEWKFIPHEAAKPDIPGWIQCYVAGEYVADTDDGDADFEEDSAVEADSAVEVDSAIEEDSVVEKNSPAWHGSGGGSTDDSIVAMDGAFETNAGQAEAADDEDDEEDGSYEIDVPTLVAWIVARIHRERPTSTVAILVRDNKSLADIVARLKEEGVDASDEGRSTLLDSPPVVLLVNLLQLIDSPSDRVAHFVVSHSALSVPLAIVPSEQHRDASEAGHAAMRFASRMRARVADEGLGIFLQSIFRILDACDLPERDRARLARAISIGELF
ncbi:MAG: UvrD-helicase domain-containing protein, partial [bacterium]